MLPINYTAARNLVSHLNPEDSPYSVLWESLPNFRSISFSDRIKVICECTSPITKRSCTVIVQNHIPGVVYGLVHIDDNFVAYIDLTDVMSDIASSHEAKVQKIREMLLQDEIIEHQYDYTIVLIC